MNARVEPSQNNTTVGGPESSAGRWLREALGIEPVAALANLIDHSMREERLELMSCPSYIGAAVAPQACVHPRNSIPLEVENAAGGSDLSHILTAASAGGSPGDSALPPFSEDRFYEALVQGQLDAILKDYEKLLARPGAGDGVNAMLTGLQSACGANPRLNRFLSTRVAQIKRERAPEAPDAVANNSRILEARVRDLNSIDNEINLLKAEFYDPSKSAEQNSAGLKDFLESRMGMLLPCGSVLRGANSVIGAVRQAGQFAGSCRIRNIAGSQFIMPFDESSPDAEIEQNLTRVMNGDRSWRPSDGAVSVVACNTTAASVEECRRSCTAGTTSDQVLYCQRTSWDSDRLQAEINAETGVPHPAVDGSIPPVVPAARGALSARDRCQSKFDLMQGLIARRALLMADFPELSHEVSGAPAYRTLARGGAVSAIDQLRPISNAHFSSLMQDRSSWFSAARSGAVGLRSAVEQMCANPRAAGEALLADPSRMREVLSCGRPDSMPVRRFGDPVAMDPSVDPNCRYLRANAGQMCGVANNLAYKRSASSGLMETAISGPMTGVDVMACMSLVGGVARLRVATVRLAGSVASVGVASAGVEAGAQVAARTALAGTRNGLRNAIRLTIQQGVESVSTARSLAMLGGFGAYGYVAGSHAEEGARTALNDSIVACSRGDSEACSRVTEMRAQYELAARSTGWEALGMMLAGIVIPGGIGDEINTVKTTLTQARQRLSTALGTASDLANVARGRALTTAEAARMREARTEITAASRAASDASRRISRLVADGRRRAQEPILARLREAGVPPAEIRRRSGLLLQENGEPVMVPRRGSGPALGLNGEPATVSGRRAEPVLGLNGGPATGSGRQVEPVLGLNGEPATVSGRRVEPVLGLNGGPARGRGVQMEPVSIRGELSPELADAILARSAQGGDAPAVATLGGGARTPGFKPDEVLTVDGAIRPAMQRLRTRLDSFFSSGPMSGRRPARVSEPTEVIPRVVSAAEELVGLVREGRISPEEGARLLAQARQIQEDFLPILEQTMRRRFRFSEEEVSQFITDARSRLSRVGESIRDRAGLEVAARALIDDPSAVLARSLAEDDGTGRMKYCGAEKAAGCGSGPSCPCSEICTPRGR